MNEIAVNSDLIPNISLKCFSEILSWHCTQYVLQCIFIFGFSVHEQIYAQLKADMTSKAQVNAECNLEST